MNLILTSSPEKDGLTATTAKVFENALNDKTEIVCLNHLNLKKCTACGPRGWGSCYKDGFCRNDEDFNSLLQKFLNADICIIITPVYFYQMSEACKLFYDKLKRCQSFSTNKCTQGKKIIFVACAGGSGYGTEETLHDFILANDKWLKMHILGTFGVNHKNKLEKFKEIEILCKNMQAP